MTHNVNWTGGDLRVNALTVRRRVWADKPPTWTRTINYIHEAVVVALVATALVIGLLTGTVIR